MPPMHPALVRPIPYATAALIVGLIVSAPAGAQTRAAAQDVCVSVDEAHDNLLPQERAAARLLVAAQFELEGWHVVPEGCPAAYMVAHVRLGRTIAITLSGPNGRRDGTALGLDDLPALYSQMVRSIVTGRPMTGMSVIDRTNVTSAQAQPPKRMSSESFEYARLGAGHGGPAFGFGHRVETNALALDVSFFNVQSPWASGTSSAYGSGSHSSSWSIVKMEALHFRDPRANASLYFGGGVSWGMASSWDAPSKQSWQGSGLQGELSVGHEIGRASTLHVFVQADVTLPFYLMTSSRPGGTRYAPSFAVSVGVGWQRGRR